MLGRKRDWRTILSVSVTLAVTVAAAVFLIARGDTRPEFAAGQTAGAAAVKASSSITKSAMHRAAAGQPTTVPPTSTTMTNSGVDSPRSSAPAPGDVVPDGQKVAAIGAIKLMNYYPSADAWTYMWTRWDPRTIAHDFGTIAAMGGNTVRLNVFPSAFGFPTPTATMESELESTVDLAAAHDLRVQLALFDWWTDYSDIADSTSWARAVLAPFMSSPDVAFIDLRNEINTADPTAMAWARAELPVVERLAGSVPVTVSIPSSPTNLRALIADLGASQPDFYDVHYYDPLGGAYAELSVERPIAAPRPLFVGETGYSTTEGPSLSTASAETTQALYLSSVEWAATELHLAPAAPWILEDLVPSGFPPQADSDPLQSGFGLLRSDGSPKPAAGVIADVFATGTVPTLVDPNFISGATNQPVGWLPTNPTQGQLSWDAGVSHAGGGSVELASTGNDRSVVPGFQTTFVPVPVYPGQVFTAWAWAKGAQVTGSNEVDIVWFGENGNYISLSRSPAVLPGTTDWSRLVVSSNAPSGAEYAEVKLSSSDNTGSVWFSNAGAMVA